VRALDEGALGRKPPRVRGPYYRMLHGTIHHLVHHTGQISLRRGQWERARWRRGRLEGGLRSSA
jgi:hypothetical protein